MVNLETIGMSSNIFEYRGEKYDCQVAIETDIELILRNAEISHKEDFEQLYDKDSLKPDKVKLYMDNNQNPMYCMIIYTINYKNNISRLACGNYYPIHDNKIYPHPFQASICW